MKRSTFCYPGMNWPRLVTQGQSPEYHLHGLFFPMTSFPIRAWINIRSSPIYKGRNLCLSWSHFHRRRNKLWFLLFYSYLNHSLTKPNTLFWNQTDSQRVFPAQAVILVWLDHCRVQCWFWLASDINLPKDHFLSAQSKSPIVTAMMHLGHISIAL